MAFQAKGGEDETTDVEEDEGKLTEVVEAKVEGEDEFEDEDEDEEDEEEEYSTKDDEDEEDEEEEYSTKDDLVEMCRLSAKNG